MSEGSVVRLLGLMMGASFEYTSYHERLGWD